MSTTASERRWKGFRLTSLEQFEVRATAAGVEVPYLTPSGGRYRTKLFPWSGEPKSRWLGASKPQIPYGLWRLPKEGDAVILTEGESDAWALMLAFPKVPVLGLPGSGSWKSEWWSYLADYRRVYLSFDGDRAGGELVAAVRADVPSSRVIELPDGADTRDLLQKLGRNAFKVLVASADASYELREAHRQLEAALRRRQRVVGSWKQQTAVEA